MKFLIVDDSPTMRRIVRNALRQSGYEDTVEAGGGNAATEALAKNEVDFVITDWNMPGMNGLDLTKSIRSHPQYSEVPILMVTTRGMEEDVIAAMRAKVNNYIVKPFTPAVLHRKIERVLEEGEAGADSAQAA